MAAITITIGRRTSAYHVIARSERNAARVAEAVIYALPRQVLPVPLTVSGCEPTVCDRLIQYLFQLQEECLHIPPMGKGASQALG